MGAGEWERRWWGVRQSCEPQTRACAGQFARGRAAMPAPSEASWVDAGPTPGQEVEESEPEDAGPEEAPAAADEEGTAGPEDAGPEDAGPEEAPAAAAGADGADEEELGAGQTGPNHLTTPPPSLASHPAAPRPTPPCAGRAGPGLCAAARRPGRAAGRRPPAAGPGWLLAAGDSGPADESDEGPAASDAEEGPDDEVKLEILAGLDLDDAASEVSVATSSVGTSSWGRVSHADVPVGFNLGPGLAPPPWPSARGPTPKAWSYATDETGGGGPVW